MERGTLFFVFVQLVFIIINNCTGFKEPTLYILLIIRFSFPGHSAAGLAFANFGLIPKPGFQVFANGFLSPDGLSFGLADNFPLLFLASPLPCSARQSSSRRAFSISSYILLSFALEKDFFMVSAF